MIPLQRILLLFILFLALKLTAQVPQAFKYQAVLRNSSGFPLSGELVKIRFSIIKDAPEIPPGTLIYQEQHTETTSSGGLISADIGRGVPGSGFSQPDFVNIAWGNHEYFVRVEVDTTAMGNSYATMGTSQLLSVPYAFQADDATRTSGLKNLTWSQIQSLQNPPPGSMYFVSDSLKIALFDGNGWFFFEPCPPLLPSNAGPDYICVCSPIELFFNHPGEGNCSSWEIITPHQPFEAYIIQTSDNKSYLYGQPGGEYLLTKSNFNHCNISEDTLFVLFESVPTTPDAGADLLKVDTNFVVLNANPPQVGKGKWSIASGQGGSFQNDSIPNARFTGLRNHTYQLVWTISNKCNLSYHDTVMIGFCPLMIQANAGSSVVNKCSPYQLQANDPGVGNIGTWSVSPGDTTYFSDIHDPHSLFYGEPGITYQLSWKISNECKTTLSNISVHFEPYPTQAFAGNNQYNIESSSYQLDANTPTIGTGQWSVLTGQGGSFSDQNYSKSIFYGQSNTLYTLEWRINNLCHTSADTVIVSFFSCGGTLYDDRDDADSPELYPTVTIGNQCWMAKNLNVGKVIYNIPRYNGIMEKYCYDNEPYNCDIYGGMYNWVEMMGWPDSTSNPQQICLTGWHIPSLNEFNTLISYLGGSSVAGGKLKETGEEYWTNNYNATNSSGFSAYGGGLRSTYYSLLKTDGRYWTSSTSGNNAYHLRLRASTADTSTPTLPTSNAISVRCIKD